MTVMIQRLVDSGETETRDGVDNNCSGDELDAADIVTWYIDSDGDGYGESSHRLSTVFSQVIISTMLMIVMTMSPWRGVVLKRFVMVLTMIATETLMIR